MDYRTCEPREPLPNNQCPAKDSEANRLSISLSESEPLRMETHGSERAVSVWKPARKQDSAMLSNRLLAFSSLVNDVIVQKSLAFIA
jgi:hypothetical protein